MFRPSPTKDCSLFPFRDLGLQEEAQRLQPAPRRQHVGPQPHWVRLCRPAGPTVAQQTLLPTPLSLRAASASHLALALSAVFVPFTQPQGLL